MLFAPGMQIGKYVLRRKIGVGGYGFVFSAHDPSLDREVALKVLKAEHTSSTETVLRFLQEARSAAKIVHPGIVTVYECAELPGQGAYIAMELLEGESLAERLERCGSLAPAVAIEIGRQLASALEAAHRAGIVHRDLKPDNVFLVPDPLVPGGERAKVLDFGIAKLGRAAHPSGLQTESLVVFGTPRYMSPEQCKSAASVDSRSDVYTLGVILFELVAGRLLFEGQPGELIAQHVLVAPPSLRSLAPDVPPALAELIALLLEKDPAARPQSMAAVQRALEAIAAGAATTAALAAARPATSDPTLPHHLFDRRDTTGSMTTLSAGAGAAAPARPARRPGSHVAVYAAAAAIAVAIPIAVYIGLRGDPEAPAGPLAGTAALAGDAASEPPPPPPEPEVARAPALDAPAVPVVIELPPPERRPPPPPVVQGQLSVVAQPPCEVQLDGKAIGRTPLAGVKLRPGRYRLTLVNAEHEIRDTFPIELSAGGHAQVSKDYSGQRKRDRRNETINPFAKGGP